MKITVNVSGRMPRDVVGRWLQTVRDFDQTHAGVHFTIAVDAPELSIEEVRALFDGLKPPFKHTLEIRAKPDVKLN